jgi:hypothetical protein
VWDDFFARWNEAVAAGLRKVPPFHPKPLPTFTPVRIENQEILQKHVGCTGSTSSFRCTTTPAGVTAATAGSSAAALASAAALRVRSLKSWTCCGVYAAPGAVV